MGKRKRKEEQSQPAMAAVNPPVLREVQEAADSQETIHDLGLLADEIQSFLQQRQELADKLAQEIEATERKLAELKRTAAMLFPEDPSSQIPAKDRKAKKSLPTKASKPRSESAATHQPTAKGQASDDDHAPPETTDGNLAGAPHEPHLD